MVVSWESSFVDILNLHSSEKEYLFFSFLKQALNFVHLKNLQTICLVHFYDISFVLKQI